MFKRKTFRTPSKQFATTYYEYNVIAIRSGKQPQWQNSTGFLFTKLLGHCQAANGYLPGVPTQSQIRNTEQKKLVIYLAIWLRQKVQSAKVLLTLITHITVMSFSPPLHELDCFT
jgi:hypothetical protein